MKKSKGLGYLYLSHIRQAIITKYLGPTNSRGSRVKVKAYAGSKIYEWDNSLSPDENHSKAAFLFASSKGWLDKNNLVAGSMPDNKGNCYVLIEKERK